MSDQPPEVLFSSESRTIVTPAFSLPDKEFRRGNACPACEQGVLDYDGLLNLSCDQCGFSLSGGAGCS